MKKKKTTNEKLISALEDELKVKSNHLAKKSRVLKRRNEILLKKNFFQCI